MMVTRWITIIDVVDSVEVMRNGLEGIVGVNMGSIGIIILFVCLLCVGLISIWIKLVLVCVRMGIIGIMQDNVLLFKYYVRITKSISVKSANVFKVMLEAQQMADVTQFNANPVMSWIK